MKRRIKIRPYHPWLIGKLKDDEQAMYYLNAAIESDLIEPDKMFMTALLNVLEARKTSRVCKRAGIAREALYRCKNPTMNTLQAVLKAIGMRLSVEMLPKRVARLEEETGRQKRKEGR